MLLVGFRGLEVRPTDPIAAALADGLGGVILFDRDQTTGGRRNIDSPDQLAALTRGLRDTASVPLLIAIDQEGGKVSRTTFPTWSPSSSTTSSDWSSPVGSARPGWTSPSPGWRCWPLAAPSNEHDT
jgi:Beta-glucosidase-related glycosidases